VECFWDGSEPADDPFKHFRAIKHINGDLADAALEMKPEELEANAWRPFCLIPTTYTGDKPAKPVIAKIGEIDANGRWGCIMVSNYNRVLIDEVAKNAEDLAKTMKLNKGRMVSIEVWPFLPTIFHCSPSAGWPHDGEAFFPLVAQFLWDEKSSDTYWIDAMNRVLANLSKVAIEQGCTIPNAPIYSNTTLDGTPLTDIYRNNLPKLSKIRKQYDPEDVMGRSGGFIIPLPIETSADNECRVGEQLAVE